jgi:hypothetical protein
MNLDTLAILGEQLAQLAVFLTFGLACLMAWATRKKEPQP